GPPLRMDMAEEPQRALFRLWDEGQKALATTRYTAARRALEAAESIAWRERDAQSLARLYLPLLEARRLIRYQAAEGRVEIDNGEPAISARSCVKEFLFLAQDAGTLLLAASRVHGDRAVVEIRQASQRTGKRIEVLFIHRHQGNCVLASPGQNQSAA